MGASDGECDHKHATQEVFTELFLHPDYPSVGKKVKLQTGMLIMGEVMHVWGIRDIWAKSV